MPEFHYINYMAGEEPTIVAYFKRIIIYFKSRSETSVLIQILCVFFLVPAGECLDASFK